MEKFTLNCLLITRHVGVVWQMIWDIVSNLIVEHHRIVRDEAQVCLIKVESKLEAILITHVCSHLCAFSLLIFEKAQPFDQVRNLLDEKLAP